MKRSSRSINEEINTYGVMQGNENSRMVFDANQSLPVNAIQNEIPRAQKRSAVNSAQEKGFRVPMPKTITKSTQSVSGSSINATRSDTSNSSSNTAHSINSNGGSLSIDNRPMRNNTNVRTDETPVIGKILSFLTTNLTSHEDKYNKQIRWLEQALNSEKLKKQEYFQNLGSMKNVNDGQFERLDDASEKLKGLEKRLGFLIQGLT